MKCDILINFFGNNNEESILCTAYLKPKQVVFIYREEDNIDSIKKYYEQKYRNIKFIAFNLGKNTKLDDVITQYKGKDAIIDISAADKFLSVEVLYEAFKYKMTVVLIDINNKEMITYSDDGIKKSSVDFTDMNINEVVKALGAKIIIESTEIGKEEIIRRLTLLIARNMKKWNEIRPILIDNNVVIHNDGGYYGIDILMDSLDIEKKQIIDYTINILERYNQIKCIRDKEHIQIKFLNNFIKGFIFKTGSWFEIFTKMIVEDIEFIDDVKCGMMFLWDKNHSHIKNEIDVVAIKDGVVICISCKDSSKYDENTLNELNVYSEKLGGKNAVKILAATKRPYKISVFDRAKEMGIDIIIYEGDKDIFKKAIRESILNKTVR